MDEEELLDWLCDVYASAGNATPTIDLTEYSVTLQNNQIVEIQSNGNTQQFGTPSSQTDTND